MQPIRQVRAKSCTTPETGCNSAGSGAVAGPPRRGWSLRLFRVSCDMDNYVIIRNPDGTFTVQVRHDDGDIRSGPTFATEAEADVWILREGKGTEYAVSRAP
jgi:hypothetical protein